MKSSLKKHLLALVAVPALVLSIGSAPVFAQESNNTINLASGGVTQGVGAARGADQPDDLFGPTGIFRTITNVLLFIIGAVSVIMLIIGGFKYVTSQGDSSKVTEAKNTILYAIIGLIVAILAFAVISFVTGQFATTNANLD